MTEVDDIRSLLEQGLRAYMILREPTQDERSRLPAEYSDATVRALPLWHPDGRKLMFYVKDPEAIECAQRVVEEHKEVIGRDVVVYVSGIGHDTVLGRTLELEGVVDSLRDLLGWELRKSEYPNTFEATFRIQGENSWVRSSFLVFRKPGEFPGRIP